MLITDIGDDGRWSKERFQGIQGQSVSGWTRPPMPMGQKELCMPEEWETPFLFASWIYRLGKRNWVTSAQGVGFLSFSHDGQTHVGWIPRLPSLIRLPCDNWPSSTSFAANWDTSVSLAGFPYLPSSFTNLVYLEAILETHWRRRQLHLHIIPDSKDMMHWIHWLSLPLLQIRGPVFPSPLLVLDSI